MVLHPVLFRVVYRFLAALAVLAVRSGRSKDLENSDQLTRTRALVHDRGSQFTDAFGEIFRGGGIKVPCSPVRTPVANAFAERWVGTIGP